MFGVFCCRSVWAERGLKPTTTVHMLMLRWSLRMGGAWIETALRKSC